MNRLQAELQRLYRLTGAEAPPAAAGQPALQSPGAGTRLMVLDLALPSPWDSLAKVWQGVQADLGLPAPAIVVAGSRSYQLWLSAEEPVPARQALAFLQALVRRYLGEVVPERIGMFVDVGGAAPPCEVLPGQWSAFVAPDLASLFADEPWLDLPPSPESQADLLSALKSMRSADLQRASERLALAGGAAPAARASCRPAPETAGDVPDPAGAPSLHPRQFLLQVMNDATVDLHLRIEAAKALLPHFDGPHGV